VVSIQKAGDQREMTFSLNFLLSVVCRAVTEAMKMEADWWLQEAAGEVLGSVTA
jgi:hypothetical protein